MRLSRCDLEAVSEPVRELYAITELSRVPHAIITLLARFIPSESISYNEFGPAAGRVISIVEPYLTNFREAIPVFSAHLGEHPVINHFLETRSLLPFRISDFLSKKQFQRTGLYNEFYRVFGVEHQLGIFLAGTRQHQVCMAINRNGRDFSERDRQILTLLRPHLTQALSNATAATELRQSSDFLNQAVKSSRQGVVWVDECGKILFITDQARNWITAYFAANLAFLPENLRAWITLQLGSPGAVREPLIVSRGDKQLRIRLIQEETQILLVLTEACESFSASKFISHGLTPRESEVLRWMAEAKSNPEIAIILGTRPRTIDKHVERILAKLQVESRKAAMLRAWEMRSN